MAPYLGLQSLQSHHCPLEQTLHPEEHFYFPVFQYRLIQIGYLRQHLLLHLLLAVRLLLPVVLHLLLVMTLALIAPQPLVDVQ